MKIPQKTAHIWPYKGGETLEKPKHNLRSESGQLESHWQLQSPCSSFIFCSCNEH